MGVFICKALIVLMRDLICGLASKVELNAAYGPYMHEVGVENASESFCSLCFSCIVSH